MERYEPAAEDPAVVTAADMVAGHVTLDISCPDRLYLNGYVAKLQTPGGVVYFFHDHRGKPIVSPALFEPIGEKFRRDIRDWAQANGVPVIRFSAGERKTDVMAPYLQAAAATGRSQVAAIGCAQEFQLVWTARKRDTDPGGCPQFSFTKEQRRVSVWRPTGFVDNYIMPLAPFSCQFRAHTRRASDTPVPSESSDDCSTLPRIQTKPA